MDERKKHMMFLLKHKELFEWLKMNFNTMMSSILAEIIKTGIEIN